MKDFNFNNTHGLSKLIYVAVLIVIIVVAAVVTYAYLSSTNQTKDVVETAEAKGSFSTLISALTTANLVDTLKGTGPFTLFAPTDAAFDALPTGLLDKLLANTTALTEVLTYHIVSGKLTANDLTSQTNVTTLQGGSLPIATGQGAPKIGPATITKTDIICTNGVIHVIDTVLIPNNIMNILQTAQYYGLSTFVTTVQTANLTSLLEGAKQYTVFPPTNSAFEALPSGTLAALADQKALADVVTYHVVSGRLLAADLVGVTTLTTVQGEKLAITSTAGGAKVNGANIIRSDIECTNGVVHVVDAVLIPP
jgi:transforming growth factor-beta-induced protein